jgi:hypothetical protein
MSGLRQILIVAGLAALNGCGGATMGDVLDARQEGRGTQRVYPISATDAWEIARTVFRREGAAAIEEHRADGYMLTSFGRQTFAGAWITPKGLDSSTVTVITKTHSLLYTDLTETRFHLSFEEALGYARAGKPIPSRQIRPGGAVPLVLSVC